MDTGEGVAALGPVSEGPEMAVTMRGRERAGCKSLRRSQKSSGLGL